ncbi:MAG: hypothetical protein MZU84_04625 [Sphingobacterium sp.]|nr:hypothetical protein [Sphingobacterium sp.]
MPTRATSHRRMPWPSSARRGCSPCPSTCRGWRSAWGRRQRAAGRCDAGGQHEQAESTR